MYTFSLFPSLKLSNRGLCKNLLLGLFGVIIQHFIRCVASDSFRLIFGTPCFDESFPYKAIYAVAPFIDKIGLPEFDPLIATFVEHDFDWDKIKKNAGHIHLLAGDNDPYVSHALTQRVEDALGVPITYIANGAHLNAAAGYTSFPLLLESILSA